MEEYLCFMDVITDNLAMAIKQLSRIINQVRSTYVPEADPDRHVPMKPHPIDKYAIEDDCCLEHLSNLIL